MPLRADLSFAILDSSVFKSKELDSDDKNMFKPKEVKKAVKPSLEKIEFVNGRNTIVENENKAKKPRKFSQSPRGKITGPKVIRPVWDNTARVNNQNKLTHPHPKRNFVPAVVLTKSGQVLVNAAKQISHRATTSVSAVRRVNAAASRPNVNNALPTTYSYFKTHSLVRRPFNQKSAGKTNNFNEKVNTAKVNNVTTAGPKVVVSAVEGNMNNAVKVIHNMLYMIKVKLLEKGKIRTGKLDFEDVYFLKEPEFNLFSVSQMCDKKNSVRFIDTECVVISHDFKLLEESQVLLKVPRNNKMYSFDLKNVVPVGGIENQMDHKGIRREFSVARTPQQNGVAERKNKTLTEAARIMLADSKLPTTFWVEAVNTACYVQRAQKMRLLMMLERKVLKFQKKENEVQDSAKDVNAVSSSFTTIDPGRERAQRNEFESMFGQDKDANRNRIITPISAVGSTYVNHGRSIPVNATTLYNNDLPSNPLMPDLEDNANLHDTRIFSGAYDDAVEGKHSIGTKWVYRNKKDERWIIVRNKARLVAQGHTQEEEINYDKVFAPVARIEAIRLFLAYALFIGFNVYQMDVKSAFLYGTIEEDVYLCQPLGFEDLHFPNKVYKVEKALYGLHQAPKAGYQTLSTYLLENRFKRGIIDKTLFIKKDKGDLLLVQVYVDDIISGSTKKSLCKKFKGLMHKKFQMSFMGELTFFLGLQVMQRDDGIFISQDKYVADILKKFDFSSVKIASTPIETNKTLLEGEEAEDVDAYTYYCQLKVNAAKHKLTAAGDIYAVEVYTSCIEQFWATAKKTQKSRRKQRKEIVGPSPSSEIPNGKGVPTTSNDLLPSGLKRLRKVGSAMIVKSSTEASLGDQEDASIQERMIDNIDQDVEITLVDETQERMNKEDMFGVNDLDGDYVVMDVSASEKVEQSAKVTEKEEEERLARLKEEETNIALVPKVKNVNGEAQIQALVDKKKVIITKASIRRDLRFDDEGEVNCLSNEVIFEQLTLMGVKFLMYPRFVQIFLDNQVEGMDRHNAIFVIFSHIKKVFANIQREGKDFSGKVTPLFQSMMVQAPDDIGNKGKKLKFLHQVVRFLIGKVLDLEEANTAQAKEIASLKKRVKKLEQKRKSRTLRLKRLRKFGSTMRVESSIEAILERMNEEDMFGVNDLDGDEMVMDVLASKKVKQSAKVIEKEVSTIDLVTTAYEVVTTGGYYNCCYKSYCCWHKAHIKGIVMQDPSETPLPKPIISSQKPSQAKDKGKGKMVELERPLNRKYHIMVDAEAAKNLKAQMQAELEKEERLARLKEEETNIDLVVEWDNIQAMMDTDYELAARL
nr:copia protein [Tanacetum cinerariifolium]